MAVGSTTTCYNRDMHGEPRDYVLHPILVRHTTITKRVWLWQRFHLPIECFVHQIVRIWGRKTTWWKKTRKIKQPPTIFSWNNSYTLMAAVIKKMSIISVATLISIYTNNVAEVVVKSSSHRSLQLWKDKQAAIKWNVVLLCKRRGRTWTNGLVVKVETPYHDNDLILTPIISPQSGWQWTWSCPKLHMSGF